MTEKDLTVRELYEMLEPLIDELGECEVRIRYDSGVVTTPIRNRLPYFRIENRTLEFEGY